MDDFKYSSPLRCMKSSTPSTTTSSSKTGFSNPNFLNMKNQVPRGSPAPDFISIGSNSPQNNFPRRFPNNNTSFHSGRSDRGFSSPNFTSSPNRSPYGRPSFNRGRNSDFGAGNRGNFRNSFRPRMDYSRGEVDISQYFHSSMLDDPWAELKSRTANSRTEEESGLSPDDEQQI